MKNYKHTRSLQKESDSQIGIIVYFIFIKLKAMNMQHGIVVYEIHDNGNLLNGIYTNIGLLVPGSSPHHYNVDNEIARKSSSDPCYNNGVRGIYACRFIETIPDPRIVSPCILTISKCGEVYEFKWTDAANKPLFEGIGMMVGDRHIAVSYR